VVTYSTDRAPADDGKESSFASLHLAPEASTIFLSIFRNPCYGGSFDQKTALIAAEFNEAGMVDWTTVGRARDGAQAGESGQE
jgi:hypothetical protein